MIPYKPLLDRAIEQAAHKPRHTIILQRPQMPAEIVAGRDLDWVDAMQFAPGRLRAGRGHHPLYILYTSGTTGQPKGVVRDHGGHATALLWTMRNIYGVAARRGVSGRPRTWAGSSATAISATRPCSTATPPSSTRASPSGRPTRAPSGGWSAEHKVAVLFTAPTAFRAIKKEDPEGTYIGKHDSRPFAPCSWPASAAIRTHCSGPRHSLACR